MVFAPLTRRKHSPRRDAMSGARVSAPRLSSFIFFHPWPVFIPFRESNSHCVSGESNGAIHLLSIYPCHPRHPWLKIPQRFTHHVPSRI